LHTTNGGKIRILEFQIPGFYFLSIRPLFDGEAWSAGGTDHESLHQGKFPLNIVPFEFFTRHELSALLETSLVYGHMENKLANIQEAMFSLLETASYWL
jgi:hypothetical protein